MADSATTEATPARVRLRGIRKSFGTTDALRGVDLDIAPGEILGLVGDNAAGKSTLSKIMSGAEVPDSGEIHIDGELVHFKSPADAQRRHIEMAYQDLSLCDTIDVAGNLYLGREPRRRFLGLPFIDRKRMHADAAAALGDLDIKVSSTHLQVANLSGGQRQSIAIGRAVSFEPRVLILDEPTSALAVAEVEAVLRLIKRVASRGVSVILITHRLQDIFRVCDRVMVMYEGTNVAERAIEETDLEDLVKLIVGGEAAAARVTL
jgi:simple sugar transport system ATP-binding protein